MGADVLRSWRQLRSTGGVPRLRLAAVAATAAVSGLADAAALLAVVQVAVTVSAGADEIPLQAGPLESDVQVSTALAVAVGLLVVRLLAGWLLARSVASVGADVLQRLRRTLISAYLAAVWPVQASVSEGRLVELLSGHSLVVARGASGVAAGIGSAATFGTLAVAALVIAPLVSLAVLTILGALMMLLRPRTRSIRTTAQGLADANVALAGSVAELSTMSAEVAAFGVADEVARGMDEDIAATARRFARLQFLRRFLPTVFQTVGLAVVVSGLALLAAVDRLDVATAGASVAIVVRALIATQPMQNTWHQLRELAPFLEQLEREQSRFAAARARDGGTAVSSVGELRLQQVSVFHDRDRPALVDVDLVVTPGEVVGVTGPSGAGKTTLLHVMLQLREPDAGAVLIDGKAARDLDRTDWFRRVAFVPQDSYLLNATVADAVRFWRRDLSDDDMERAIRLAHMDHIAAWPAGYDTAVGPRTAWLSGGERQRLSIARALAAHPDLLVMDEPTSALDAHSEALIRDTLSRLKGRVTVVVAAHRLSTLEICDRIVVLEGGRITAVGSPTALAATDGFYRDAVGLSRLSDP